MARTGSWGSGRAGCGLDVSTSLASEGPGAARRLVPVAPRLSQMALPASAPRDWAQPLGGALPQLPPCPAGGPPQVRHGPPRFSGAGPASALCPVSMRWSAPARVTRGPAAVQRALKGITPRCHPSCGAPQAASTAHCGAATRAGAPSRQLSGPVRPRLALVPRSPAGPPVTRPVLLRRSSTHTSRTSWPCTARSSGGRTTKPPCRTWTSSSSKCRACALGCSVWRHTQELTAEPVGGGWGVQACAGEPPGATGDSSASWEQRGAGRQ